MTYDPNQFHDDQPKQKKKFSRHEIATSIEILIFKRIADKLYFIYPSSTFFKKNKKTGIFYHKRDIRVQIVGEIVSRFKLLSSHALLRLFVEQCFHHENMENVENRVIV